jgi:hypothetical protein
VLDTVLDIKLDAVLDIKLDTVLDIKLDSVDRVDSVNNKLLPEFSDR